MKVSILSNSEVSHKKWIRGQQQKWLNNRLKVADSVLDMSADGVIETTPDAEILLCCHLAGVSSKLWIGERIDRFKFIQLLIEYCSIYPHPSKISIPALMLEFKEQPEEKLIRAAFWNYPAHQCVSANLADKNEYQIRSVFPNLPLSKIRNASYAAIIYKDLRCGLIHSGELDSRLIDKRFPIPDEPYYINRTTKFEFKDNQLKDDSSPVLYLPYSYLREVTKSTIEAVFDAWEKSSSYKQDKAHPAQWWIQG